MIVIAAAIIGAILGVHTAKKRGGVRADLWQYGAVYAMIFAVAGLFLTLGIHRAAM